MLRSAMPNPCLVFDRYYNVVAANPAVHVMLYGVDPELLAPPINVVKLSLHPRGTAPLIVNFRQWREHILTRLERQTELTGDADLASLLAEVSGYPAPESAAHEDLEPEHPGVLLPLRFRTPGGVLTFISTVTVFGTPHEITLQELAIESFFPADDFTAAELARLAGGATAGA
jgi:hypothetical protein